MRCEGCHFDLSLTEAARRFPFCNRCADQMRSKHFAAMANVHPLTEAERQESLERFQAMPEPPYAVGRWYSLGGLL